MVSVVIPTHDRCAILARTLDTVLAQRDVELEVVIVDDGCTDGTTAYLAAHTDPRIRVVRHDVARGPSGARNAGVRAARGDWIAFLDDDDLWSPVKLASQLSVASKHGADVVYCGAVRVDQHLAVLDDLPAPDPATILPALLEHNVIPAASGVMATASILRTAGGFDERLTILADWDMWLRLVEAGTPGAADDRLVAYVAHARAMSTNATDTARADRRVMAVTHRDLTQRLGQTLGGERFWLWIVWGHRLSGRRLSTARAYVDAAVRSRRPLHLARAAAALVGPPIMDFGPAWGKRVETKGASPEWLTDLRTGAPAPRVWPQGAP